MYVCTKCKETKTRVEMSLDASRRDGISSWCKLCRAVSSRKWGQNNPDKVKEQSKQKRLKPFNPTQARDYILKYRYDLSLEDYNNKLKNQNYSCAICKRDSREMTYYLHVDHNHTTGKVRGLLCSPCNTYLGYIRDNPEVYHNGLTYLEAYK